MVGETYTLCGPAAVLAGRVISSLFLKGIASVGQRGVYGKEREARLQQLWSLIVYTLAALCCITQAVADVYAAGEGSRDESWQRTDEAVTPGRSAPTKVTVVGNRVLVPVTLVYQGNEVEVQLLLDTGASETIINNEIADQLNVDLRTARRAQVRVVGGAVIEAHRVWLPRITVGPHTKENVAVLVIPHTGPATVYDGLLGMNILRSLRYRVDLKNQIILWE